MLYMALCAKLGISSSWSGGGWLAAGEAPTTDMAGRSAGEGRALGAAEGGALGMGLGVDGHQRLIIVKTGTWAREAGQSAEVLGPADHSVFGPRLLVSLQALLGLLEASLE